ncbi:phosphoinositide phospholipase C 1-like isoform X2 [Herrania umbratica]|uniref:Phosphoinositide phospholipase C n=1 Tax=Herrania umbratica TaxID=108875 RepID=A0A6J0ZXJ2_9ROSI|nr:phosphoinositide phospholipase C 1-like isoform X2 [Herrania umbratica]
MLKQSFKVCLCWRRIFKTRVVEPPLDVKNVFYRYSPGGMMTIDELLRFLIEHQGEQNATKEDAQAIFDSLKHLNIFHRRGLHLEAFFRYLLGDHNLAHPPSQKVHHDMDAPLAHYFLFTGHNSYLTGNQLSSASSVEPIKDALLKGVRVIELDLWPNSKGKDVEVRHGGTLTSPVDLQKCLQAIKENAFTNSEYPVVITFEDHLNSNLQKKVAKMVKETFEEMLYCTKSENLEEFPSPEFLKKKVLISTKPPKEYLEGETIVEKKWKKSKSRAGEDVSENESATARNEHQTSRQNPPDEAEHVPDEDEEKAVNQYRELIAIHAGKLKGGLENWLSDDPNKVRRLSLSEQELENATKTHGTEIVRFTQRNLLRVYPKGTRLDSSNYNPFVGWMHGAQMVAFNMQGYGKHLWIMKGMFKANGGCGYVKKPDFLLQRGPNDEVFNPYDEFSVKTVMTVKVILGEGWHQDFPHTAFDRYSPPDFYTRIGIAGIPADRDLKETEKIEDEWLPVWNEEFEFLLRVPELAVLRIEVLEYDTTGRPDFGGQTCLPVSELTTGIRTVPLHSKKGDKYKHVRLLLSIKFGLPYDF